MFEKSRSEVLHHSSSSAVAKEYLASDRSLFGDSLLLCAPEALAQSRWRDTLDDRAVSGRIVAVVVDEAPLGEILVHNYVNNETRLLLLQEQGFSS